MHQAKKIPDANAVVDKEWEKRYKLPAYQMTKVNSKSEVIEEAQEEGRTVHSATRKDICHLKNSELEPKFQQYKGRVVLRVDIVKNIPTQEQKTVQQVRKSWLDKCCYVTSRKIVSLRCLALYF